MKNINVVFMGTPDFAVPALEMLIENTNVVMVVTKPDSFIGRKKEIYASPVKKVALKNSIPVFQPNNIKKDYEILKSLKIDLIVTCAYGYIIPKEVLDMPKYGCINIHASLLPKYRGSAPIQWALINGDEKTGVTIMYMDEGMDTGDIITEKEILIEDNDDVKTLHEKLSILGRDTLEYCLKDIINNKVTRIKQGSDFTMAPMIDRAMEKIDFNDCGKNIINKIRAMHPWPLAHIIINDLEIKVLKAHFIPKKVLEVGKIIDVDKKNLGISCKDGIIYLDTIKPAGKKEMPINNFLNGINPKKYLKKEVN